MRTRRRFLRIWHRRIGMLSSLLLMWIAVTGLMLNHTALLGLQGATGFGRLAQWMGVAVSCDPRAWQLGEQSLSACENGAYLGERRLADVAPVHAATQAAGWILVLGSEHLWVFTPEGQPVDGLALPAALSAGAQLWQADEHIVLAAGDQAWQLDADELVWQKWSGDARHFSAPESTELSAAAIAALERQASGAALNWSKLLQDLHTGRVLSNLGSALLDIAGVSLLLLALLGIAIDLRRAHVQRRQRNR